jgi:hypothetical protein
MPTTVRITKGFQQYVRGQLVTVGGGVADAWIRRGVAAPVAASQAIETAAVEPVVETADRTPRRRRMR